MAIQAEKSDRVNIEEMNDLINKALAVLQSAMRSRHVTPKERRGIALDLVRKAMPSGISMTHEMGDSFLDMVKKVNSQEKKKLK